MYKKLLFVLVISLALLLTMLPVTSVSAAVPRLSEIAVGTIGEPEVGDPGWLYDTASGELVDNVYDTLLEYYVNRSKDVKERGRTDQFIASLAYEWYFDEATDVFYFKIRGQHRIITMNALMPVIPTEPVSTQWEAILPPAELGGMWHLLIWEDNNLDGILSACDIVKMEKKNFVGPAEPPVIAYHVEAVSPPYPGLVTQIIVKELPVPFQCWITLTVPVVFPPPYESTTVTEVGYKNQPLGALKPLVRTYHIDEWEDGQFSKYDGVLSAGDVIKMTRSGTPPPEFPNAYTRYYIVESLVGTTLVVKPCLTCWDVEYTMKRWVVLDHSGGPQWMIYEPLFYPKYSWPLIGTPKVPDLAFAPIVSAAIKGDCSWVWFKFAGPYPTMIFKQVFAQPWASIQYMDWSIDEGCWDGYFTQVSLNAAHDPAVSPLMDPEPVMCGTGPYFLVEWISGKHWRIERFDEHWQQWPAPGCDSYVDVVRMEFISEWPTRKLMFLAGDLDFCYVPTQYKADVEGKAGIRCTFPLPSLVSGGNFYNFNISLTSRYLYPPFTTHLDYGVIAGTGIPPDFFSDLNLRKAFCYSVNYTEFLQLAYLGEAQYPATPAIFGLPYRRPQAWYDANQYYYDPIKATYYFKLAWGGDDPTPGDWDVPAGHEGLVWKNGFKLPLCYNTGNVARKTMADDEIEPHVEALNEKFIIDVYDVEWGTVYLPELWAGKLPMFIIGWQADFPDPHNFFFPFMHSTGAFSAPQSYNDPHVDELIEEGGTCVDETRREEIYYELQEIYIRDAPSVCTYQPTGRHWERTWIYGWYYNPIYSGGYFKEYWKDTPPGVITVQPVDLSVMHSMSNVTQVIITAHTNPPLINDQKPYLKIVTGPAKGSRPRIIVQVHWDRADANNLINIFWGVIGLKLQRGTTVVHVEGIATFPVGAPGDSDTVNFILDLSTLTAKAYAGRWNCSAEIGVADETAYDSVLANNTILDDWCIVLGTGDIYYKDLLGLVDISDLVRMVDAVGSMPGDLNWNWYADIYQATITDNKVDISDLSALVTLVGVTDYVDPV